MTTPVITRKIDVDTHFYPPVDYQALRAYLPQRLVAQVQDMLVRDAMRAMEPERVAAETRGVAPPARPQADPHGDADARAAAMEQLVAAMGSEHFFFGTDYPHPEFQRYHNTAAAILDRPGLSQTDKDNILGNNIARFLKLA
jgi:predicted TIM-barrel fold metal-dependent hydrolase